MREELHGPNEQLEGSFIHFASQSVSQALRQTLHSSIHPSIRSSVQPPSQSGLIVHVVSRPCQTAVSGTIQSPSLILKLNCIKSCILRQQVPVSAGPGGKLSVLLKSFSNPSNLDLNGNCCESPCRSCDYYLKICLKETAGGSCVKSVTTKTYDNTKYVVFKLNEAFKSGERNPLVWAFSSWKVTFLRVITELSLTYTEELRTLFVVHCQLMPCRADNIKTREVCYRFNWLK